MGVVECVGVCVTVCVGMYVDVFVCVLDMGVGADGPCVGVVVYVFGCVSVGMIVVFDMLLC